MGVDIQPGRSPRLAEPANLLRPDREEGHAHLHFDRRARVWRSHAGMHAGPARGARALAPAPPSAAGLSAWCPGA